MPSINFAACRGKPLGRRTPTSVDVPPMSATRTVAFEALSERDFRLMPARKDAPRMEFVAPLENVLIGSLAAAAAEVRVPSFYNFGRKIL